MKIDRDQLIRRVAEKHRLILTEDDPLITSVTLHEVLFESYSQQLIQKMDEQNTTLLAALNSTINHAKSNQKAESERLMHTLNALHKKTLDDYREITIKCLDSLQTLFNETKSAKQSGRFYAGFTAFFGIIFFWANLYLLSK